jgi:hypothetical protein
MSDKKDNSVGGFTANERGLVNFTIKVKAFPDLVSYEQRKVKVLECVEGTHNDQKFSKGPSTIKRIHVNQHHIKANRKAGNEDLPVYTIKNRGETLVATTVDILGPSRLVYKSEDPLSCGAHCWIETTAEAVFEESDGSVTWIR